MRMIKLGNSGMEVSRIGFGGIPIQRASDEEAVRVIQRAIDQGINWIDTAHGYGTSEERFGRAIKRYDRERLYIFTKGPGTEPEEIREQFTLSLERLDTDYIDLYQFHNPKSPVVWRKMERNGTLEFVLEMRDKGLIRHLGSSAHTKETAYALLEHPEIEVLQYPFNFIMEKDGGEVLDRCREKGVGFIAMKPFGGGVLEDARICIRFYHQYADVVLDPGFEKLEEVDQVVALCREETPLSDRDRKDIRRMRSELGVRFCRRCGYCSPCPQEVKIISLMNMNSFLKRFPLDRFLAKQAKAMESYDNCTDCGECEEKCPYQLPIRETMRIGVDTYQRLKAERTTIV